MRGAAWLAVPAIALVAASCAAQSPVNVAKPVSTASAMPTVTPSASPSMSPSAPPCAPFDKLAPVSSTSIDFEPEWCVGQGAGGLPIVDDDAISALVDREPAKYTSIIVMNGLIVTLPDGDDLAERKAALDRLTDVPVRFVIAEFSRAEQQRLQDELSPLMTSGSYAGDIVGIGTDPRGAVMVYLDRDRDTTQTRQALKKRYGSAIVFREMGKVTTLIGR